MTSGMPHPFEGQACAVGKDDAPKSYADIPNFGDPADLWYESYARERSNMYVMKVVTDMYDADVLAEATVIDSTTAFRNKFGPSGDVVDRKTRICARGDQQQAGFDYGEVFSHGSSRHHTCAVRCRCASRFAYTPDGCQGSILECFIEVTSVHAPS